MRTSVCNGDMFHHTSADRSSSEVDTLPSLQESPPCSCCHPAKECLSRPLVFGVPAWGKAWVLAVSTPRAELTLRVSASTCKKSLLLAERRRLCMPPRVVSCRSGNPRLAGAKLEGGLELSWNWSKRGLCLCHRKEQLLIPLWFYLF